MAWGLIMQRVQSEKQAVFFPLNIPLPKKKSISYKEKIKQTNYKFMQCEEKKYIVTKNIASESCHQ